MPRDALVRGILVGALMLLVGGAFVSVMVLRTEAASAQDRRSESGGIYAEQTMSVDGVVVRRVRDRSNGVVCYVVSGRGQPQYRSETNGVAISCVEEQR